MSKTSIFYGFGGLILGLVIGFFAANSINKTNDVQVENTVAASDTQFSDQKIQNIVVRDQPTRSAAMPEIAETLEKATNEPDNFDAQVASGKLYARIQNFAKAIEFYQAANKLKPEHYETIVALGNLYFDDKQYENAEIWYVKALEKQPKDFAVRTDLGLTFVERANPDINRAIKEFKSSLESNPKHEVTIYNLAAAYYKSGDLENARTTAKTLEELNPKSELNSQIKAVIQ